MNNHHELHAKFYQHGREAYGVLNSAAPAINKHVQLWLAENDPRVGDTRTTVVMRAYRSGWQAAADDAAAAALLNN